MKRELIENTKVMALPEEGIDRLGYLSAVVGFTATADGEATVTITDSDDNTTFEAVADELVFADRYAEGGVTTIADIKSGDLVNVDIDLLGCKQYVKVAVSGTAAADAVAAIALGDASEMPV